MVCSQCLENNWQHVDVFINKNHFNSDRVQVVVLFFLDQNIMWSLRYSRCVKLPPPQFCNAVNPYTTNRGCVGFCSIVCLLMAIKFLNDDKHRSLKWLRARLDGCERMEDDPFSLQKFLYLFHDLNRLGFV